MVTWDGSDGAALSALTVPRNATLFDALAAVDANAQAIVFVVDDAGRVLGSLTDGDCRRALLGGAALTDRCLEQAMCSTFVRVTPETGRAEVLDLMRARHVGQIPILDAEGRLFGLHTLAHMLSAQKRPNAAFILAGGKGTRLYPLTHSIPKPMVTVAGRPILERLILHLMSCGVHRFYVSVNYLAHIIEEHFGDGSRFGCTIQYIHESQPLSTGGPLSLLDPVPEHPMIVVNGDLVTQCDVGRMLDYHTAGHYLATCGLRPHTVDIPFGVACVDQGRLTGLQEKPSYNYLVNAGIYVVSPDAIRLIPRAVEYPITELFAQCLTDGRPVGAYVVQEEWIDVGRHDELRRARGIDA